MNLVKLLLIHAIVTFAAGVVLLVAPDLIPRTVGIRIIMGKEPASCWDLHFMHERQKALPYEE